MPTPDQTIGTVIVQRVTSTASGALVELIAQDVVAGTSVHDAVPAPKAVLSMTQTQLGDWARQAMVKRAAQWIDREVEGVIDALRQGRNPLRDDAGQPQGTTHLSYAEAAHAVFTRLYASPAPGDRILAAQISQTLTDAEIAAITGLDAAGVQALREQATAALQAAALMQQAGGSW